MVFTVVSESKYHENVLAAISSTVAWIEILFYLLKNRNISKSSIFLTYVQYFCVCCGFEGVMFYRFIHSQSLWTHQQQKNGKWVVCECNAEEPDPCPVEISGSILTPSIWKAGLHSQWVWVKTSWNHCELSLWLQLSLAHVQWMGSQLTCISDPNLFLFIMSGHQLLLCCLKYTVCPWTLTFSFQKDDLDCSWFARPAGYIILLDFRQTMSG